jgi:DNA-binding transcriptional MerR regulator
MTKDPNEKKLTNGEIAKALGVSAVRVTALRKEGMPTDSIEEILEWRNERENKNKKLAPSIDLEILDDGSIAERIRTHRIKVNLAGDVWEQSIRERDPNQGKYQTAYNQSLTKLLHLEEEQERRSILAKTFIKASEAKSAMQLLMTEVLARLDKIGLENAERCNPDNPALAAKVLDAWSRKVRLDLSQPNE